MTQQSQNFYSQTYKDLLKMGVLHGLPEQTAGLLFNWHYKKNKRTHLAHQDLSKKARDFFYTEFKFELPKLHTISESEDKTAKFLMQFSDELKAETVLIPFQNKYTLCLSSQVGCAMNCSFCFTGKQGFTRHLTTDEIVGQYLVAKQWLSENRPASEDRILNIVFMGQGEPLHNFDNVRQACDIFISQHGLSLAGHKITVSTSGYLPGLERWNSEMPDVNIALSLHSPFNEKRNELIPINRKYPLEKIIPLVESIPTGKKRFVTYEYLLIKDFNDGPEDSRKLGEMLTDTKAFLNIIPFNPYPGGVYKRPSHQEVLNFKTQLEQYGFPVTVRTTKGDEILAACGQLNINSSRL